jgi:hypothetical protein
MLPRKKKRYLKTFSLSFSPFSPFPSVIATAREQVAELIGAPAMDVIFTPPQGGSGPGHGIPLGAPQAGAKWPDRLFQKWPL